MANPLCHFEFMTGNVEKCQAFYGSVFSWEFNSKSMPGYTLIGTGQEPGGGMMKTPPDAPGPSFTVYFLVDDIGATLAKVEKAGGTILQRETPIPNVGAFAVFADPDSNVLGIFKHG